MSRGARVALLLLVIGWVDSLRIHRSRKDLQGTLRRGDSVNQRSADYVDFPSGSTDTVSGATTHGGAPNGTTAVNRTVSELESNGHKRWRLPFLRTMFQRLVEERRKRGLQRSKRQAVSTENLFETPVGKALLDSLSKGYTREKGLGNGIGDSPVFAQQPGTDKLLSQDLNDDKASRKDTLFGPDEPFGLTVRRALMDSLCYPGDSKDSLPVSDERPGEHAVGPDGRKSQDGHKVLRRLKRYLEIVRVKVHPGEPKTLDAFSVARGETPDRAPSSQLPEPNENPEFHKGALRSNLHASRDTVVRPRPHRSGEEKTGEGAGNRLDGVPPSLLESLSSLLSSLDTGLADIVAEAAHSSNDSGRTLVRRERPFIDEHLVQQHPDKLPRGMEELVERLDRKSKRKWAYEKTDAVGEMHHVSHLAPNEKGAISTNEKDTEVLKKLHHYNVPAYKYELREAKEMLEKLQAELNKRKSRWMA